MSNPEKTYRIETLCDCRQDFGNDEWIHEGVIHTREEALASVSSYDIGDDALIAGLANSIFEGDWNIS